jgi:hypothetical protein
MHHQVNTTIPISLLKEIGIIFLLWIAVEDHHAQSGVIRIALSDMMLVY